MKKVYNILTIVSLVIGILVGIFMPSFTNSIAFIGNDYINILKILIGPIIFCAISLSILNHKKGDSKILFKTVLLFIIMFVSTFLLSSLVIFIIKPGKNFVTKDNTNINTLADFTLLSILKNLLPSSIEGLVKGKSIFFIIILGAIISLIMLLFKNIKDKYIKLLTTIKNWLDIVLKGVILLTPLAVISLVSSMINTYGKMIIDVGLIYILMAYIISILVVLVIMILPVWIIAKINPIQYIKKVAKVWLISLSTCSSVATLPHTIKCCNEDFNIDEKITNIVVPLGCTIHMCGGAVSFSLLGLFVAQMSGISVSVGMYLLMVLSATLINMAAPGIPGGGVVIGFTYLSLLGLPINSFYGFYSGAYKLLDMPYTTLNVTGDISANILLNHFNNKKL